MALLPEYREDLPRVKRFSLWARIAHWGHALTFFVCFVSGMVIFLRSSTLAALFGGMAGASLVHKVSAAGLILFMLAYLVFGFRSLLRWAREILRFGKRDVNFLLCFPRKFFGLKVDVPPQTKLNGGEKLNSIVSSSCVLAIVGSGLIIWFPDRFSVAVVQWSYLVHTVAMIVAVSLAIMHAYLGSLHPETGEAFWGMWKGTVRADWAKKHHSIWFDEEFGDRLSNRIQDSKGKLADGVMIDSKRCRKDGPGAQPQVIAHK